MVLSKHQCPTCDEATRIETRLKRTYDSAFAVLSEDFDEYGDHYPEAARKRHKCIESWEVILFQLVEPFIEQTFKYRGFWHMWTLRYRFKPAVLRGSKRIKVRTYIYGIFA